MKIGALAPWFGGKRSMAADIVRELGPHTQYFEPFCGSMAVLMAKPPAQKETVRTGRCASTAWRRRSRTERRGARRRKRCTTCH